MALVLWPHECMGCGEINADHIKSFAYEYRKGRLSEAVHTLFKKDGAVEQVTLNVSAFLCPECKIKGRTLFIGKLCIQIALIATLGILLGVIGDGYGPLFAVVLVLIVFTVYTIAFAARRHNPAMHFNRIRYRFRSRRFTFHFSNKNFRSSFKSLNPSIWVCGDILPPRSTLKGESFPERAKNPPPPLMTLPVVPRTKLKGQIKSEHVCTAYFDQECFKTYGTLPKSTPIDLVDWMVYTNSYAQNVVHVTIYTDTSLEKAVWVPLGDTSFQDVFDLETRKLTQKKVWV